PRDGWDARFPPITGESLQNARDLLSYARRSREGDPKQKALQDAVQFYVQAFANNPRLAEDFKVGHRYKAARAAAIAAAGFGSHTLDDKERARLRQLALNWLRADLAAWSEWSRSENLEAKDHLNSLAVLKSWKTDPALDGVRDT